jgi:hypothetical protein
MIQTSVLHRVLNGHYILDIFHHADKRAVSGWITTDFTSFIVAYVVADIAVMHPTTHFDQALGQRHYPTLILPKQMESQAKSRLAAYSRQSVDFHYGFL